MIDRARWNDRAVVFDEFNQLVGDEIMAAFGESARKGGRLLLVHGMRYADTNEPVFASLAEVEALPFRHFERLNYLSARVAHLNGMSANDPDRPPPDAKPNGHAEPPGPSH